VMTRTPGVRRSAWLASVLGLLAVGSSAAPSFGVEAGESPRPGVPTVVADGPFGRVAGVAAATMPDPADLPVLDAWAPATTMVLRPTHGILSPSRAVAFAEPALDPTTSVELGAGDGDATIELPTSGLFLIRVDGTIRPDGDALEGTWWWRVAVPDRTLPDEETGPPPPTLRLGSGDDVVELEQGSGCFLGTCGDIGRVSPPDLLPTIRSIPGAPLSLTLADGSGMDGWSVSVSPVEGDGTDGILLGEGPGSWSTTGWVPAPDMGDWVVAVSVTFDRERGHIDGYGRLRVGPPPTE
jgi:hypothetical protein